MGLYTYRGPSLSREETKKGLLRLDSLDPVAYGGGVELPDTRVRYPNLACSGTEPGG